MAEILPVIKLSSQRIQLHVHVTPLSQLLLILCSLSATQVSVHRLLLPYEGFVSLLLPPAPT